MVLILSVKEDQEYAHEMLKNMSSFEQEKIDSSSKTHI